jgi:2-polyprenyl-6-methoxyphenol hydroxylase-like FAD-dependent oxidoreductase
VEFAGLRPDAAGVNVRLNDLESGITAELRARFVVGCDGHRSAVRQALGIRVREKVYRQRWVMGDFTDATGLGDTAHLFFAPAASVESFPLPNHQRRWIVLRPPHDATEPAEYLVQQVRRLTGHDPGALAPGSVSCFGAKRMLADRYGVGRVWLAGDTAHVMSSIGGQGMNTGFADAAHAAQALMAVGDLAERLGGYETARKQAYRVAAGRAERGMYFGTARGRLMSRIRQVVIRDILFSRWCADRLAPYFAMLTIPNQPLLGEAV